MKFTCDKNDFQNAVAITAKAAASKSTIPALEGLLIETQNDRLKITGYDLKKGIYTFIDSSVQEHGSIVLNARLLGEMIRRMPDGTVEVIADEKGKVDNLIHSKDDENLIINSVILKEQDLRNGLVMSFNDVGRYKRDAWAPQKEVRYQFFALPHNQEGVPIVNFNFTETGLPFSYWDASLSDEGFDSIEVTIGPKMEVEDRQRVSVLMNNCFPNGDDRIHQSVLKIK